MLMPGPTSPLISIITHLILHSDYHGRIELLYSSRKSASGNITSILFMERIHELFKRDPSQRRYHYTIFCTDSPTLHPFTFTRKWGKDMHFVGEHQTVEFRRFGEKDLETALGPVAERESTVAYVCGPPAMTDWAVDVLKRSKGMDQERVLCEKWW